MKKRMNVFPVVLSLTLGLMVQSPVSSASTGLPVVDRDGNGLIEINNLNDLNDIRNDLTGASLRGSSVGCPASRCSGYELTRDLDFDTNGNGVIDSGDWNGGKPWVPIGGQRGTSVAGKFTAMFNGQGHRIRNLHVALSQQDDLGYYGLFGATDGAYIGFLWLENARVNIVGGNRLYDVGVLAGAVSNNTQIISVYVKDAALESDTSRGLGGLAGWVIGSSIHASFYSGDVRHTNLADPSAVVGGLVGTLRSSLIDHSYAKGTVSGPSAAGLVSSLLNSGVKYSFSNVQVTARSSAGGLINNAHYDLAGPDAATSPDHYLISDNYALGSITLDTDMAGGLINIIQGHFGARATLRNNYSANLIRNRLQGSQWAALAYYGGNSGITRQDNYWVVDPEGHILSSGSSNLSSGGYLREDLQCAAPDQSTGCRYPALFDNWDFRWDYGTTQELPAIRYGINQPWISTDRPDANGDYENLRRLRTHYPEYSCDNPGLILAKEKKTSNYFLTMDTYPNLGVLSVFNAQQGLVCLNLDQPNGVCQDYEVRYRCDETRIGGSVYWTDWMNNATPNATGDHERLQANRHFCLAGDPIGIEARVRGSSWNFRGPPQKLSLFSAARGLNCLNSDTRCKDYEVRMNCPVLGDR